MARAKFLVLLLFVVGCTQTKGAEICSVSFAPVKELKETMVKVTGRWSLATGCEISVKDNGIPVVLTSNPTLADGTPKRAVYDANEHEIRYRQGEIVPWTAEAMLMHEVGHALGCEAHQDGVMADPTQLYAKITQTDLACVCAVLDCSVFNPEK